MIDTDDDRSETEHSIKKTEPSRKWLTLSTFMALATILSLLLRIVFAWVRWFW